ncbi:hypothetical protein AB0N38_16870 [Micromonospora aurantiaca]|uniref:NERD domain-containing protein n=1 Tax=Micromonospora aurantiaca (nom. illeg.) TaxID=47850 RepID=A0A1C6TDJ3_9ACTN|nr:MULTISPECIES: hypothetical protein [Micromonospora]ADL49712.1 hypothetical protein Micau_6219 [Micromonospora aurantiaca ATCC 27029]ADU11624.1 hypothetical protein ML5_6181 [Micromonospora sp. L5]AXH89806.1 hypothetical protein DVH21_07585 [Micromonospora aurantiaca]KAB1117288.1 hypothetical protein F6X54_08200 [Micromonospora aurantiaca]MDG4754902.1 hypothetical protein [Micromonospora sp. WMMD718]
MTVFPARRAVPSRALPPRTVPHSRVEPTSVLEPARPTPLEWARRRRAERGARRLEAAGARALGQLDHLGPAWHVIEWPRTDPADMLLDRGRDDRAGFLAIGPSGLFAVTIADHGRARVLVAGDVVQINGKRPPYVAEARRDAKRASKALSDAVGLPIPVTPVLTFVGSGVISVYGLPKDCLMATHRELDRLLVAGGNRISPATAEKLSRVAQAPATWFNGTYRPTADYRWYDEGRTAADKQAARR